MPALATKRATEKMKGFDIKRLARVALDAVTEAEENADDAAMASTVAQYLVNSFVRPAQTTTSSNPPPPRPAPAALCGADCLEEDVVGLEAFAATLIDAAQRFMVQEEASLLPAATPSIASPFTKGGGKNIGLKERNARRRQIIAFEEEEQRSAAATPDQEEEPTAIGAPNEVSIAAAGSSDSDADDDAKRAAEERELWSRHHPGAEATVEAMSLMRLVNFDIDTVCLYKAFAAAVYHSTVMACLRAATSDAHGTVSTHASAKRFSNRARRLRSADDCLAYFAFHCGMEEEELRSAYDAFVASLPEKLVGREAAAQAAIAAALEVATSSRRNSFRDSRRSSGVSSTMGSEASFDDDGERQAANRDDGVVLTFYFVLTELRDYDAAWAAWVPERSAAAQTHHRSRIRRRQSSFMRKTGSFSSKRPAVAAEHQ